MLNNKCFLREAVLKYAEEKYGTRAEYLWSRFPDYGVLRHADNRKWYGIIMNVDKAKLGLTGKGVVDILNVKTDDVFVRDMLLNKKGYFRAYHMNKEHWISLLLEGTVPLEEVLEMLDMGYLNTASKNTLRHIYTKAK